MNDQVGGIFLSVLPEQEGEMKTIPVIDMVATGRNIQAMRKAAGISPTNRNRKSASGRNFLFCSLVDQEGVGVVCKREKNVIVVYNLGLILCLILCTFELSPKTDNSRKCTTKTQQYA